MISTIRTSRKSAVFLAVGVHVVRLQGPQREAERDDGVERGLPEDDGQSVGTNKDAAVRNKRSER